MFVSTVIPTIGRASLDRAVNSVLAQECSERFEVIVVNDSGRPLAAAGWQGSPQVKMVNTCQHERSVARNTGAAMAMGRYLHFLDDDDWLLPGAFQALMRLAEATRARWLYGGSQLVDRRGNRLIELHHGMTGNCALQVMAGEWVPLQSSLFDARLFFSIGGFNPLIPGAEDTEFTRRVALKVNIAGTRELVSCIGMGTEGSTTDYARSRMYTRSARERILEQAGTFRRLGAGASSAYWSGRLSRIYLSSAVWNLAQKRLATAVSRFGYGLVSLVLTGRGLVTRSFWRALGQQYRNETFERGFRKAGL